HTIPQNALTQLRDPIPLRAAAILPPIVATPRRAAEVAATVEEVGLIVGAVVVEAIVEEVALPTAAEGPRTVAAEASATAVAVVLTAVTKIRTQRSFGPRSKFSTVGLFLSTLALAHATLSHPGCFIK